MDYGLSFGGAAELPSGTPPEIALEEYFRQHRRIPAGQPLVTAGDRCSALFVVCGGAFKTGLIDGDGRERVLAFPLAGDPIGLDGLAEGAHCTTAIALEDSTVRVIPYEILQRLSGDVPALARYLHAALSREIGHRQRMLLMLGSMNAQERLAAFLHDFAGRRGSGGEPAMRFWLPMRRIDLGSYLGLTGATVSRLISRLMERRVVRVHRNSVQVLDMPLLRALSGNAAARHG